MLVYGSAQRKNLQDLQDLHPQDGVIPCSPLTARSTRFTGFTRSPPTRRGDSPLAPGSAQHKIYRIYRPCSSMAARSTRIYRIYRSPPAGRGVFYFAMSEKFRTSTASFMEQEQMFLTTKSADSTTITHLLYPLIVVLSAYFFLHLKILVDYIPPAAMIPRSARIYRIYRFPPTGRGVSPLACGSGDLVDLVDLFPISRSASFTGFIDLRPQGGAIPCSPLAARTARFTGFIDFRPPGQSVFYFAMSEKVCTFAASFPTQPKPLRERWDLRAGTAGHIKRDV